jgi:hypothetical protein
MMLLKNKPQDKVFSRLNYHNIWIPSAAEPRTANREQLLLADPLEGVRSAGAVDWDQFTIRHSCGEPSGTGKRRHLRVS